jgi:copper(I)-binding protein
VLAFVQGAPARAEEVKAGDLVITEAWTRATPKGAKIGGGYLTIENKGTAPDRLIGSSADIAGSVQVHEMSIDKGVMKMRPLENGLAIEPGKTVKLTQGGDHLMMMKEPDQEGRQADHAGVREGRQGVGVPRRRGRAGTDCLSQFWHQEG